MGTGGPPAPAGRRDPAKDPLTRASIVAAAVRLMDDAPRANATLRKVATALQTGPASLYAYFRDAEELHVAVLEHYLGGLDLPPHDGVGGAWRPALVGLLTRYAALLATRPQLARTAAAARADGPNHRRLVDQVAALLADGGVEAGPGGGWAVDLLLLHVAAHALARPDDRDAVDETRLAWDLAVLLDGLLAGRHQASDGHRDG